MGYEFDGVRYERLRDMQAARHARYAQLLEAGMNFTRAAHAVGVSKRTGKVWRNGRTRSNGRNERPLVDWYGGRVNDSNTPVSSRYLSMDERVDCGRGHGQHIRLHTHHHALHIHHSARARTERGREITSIPN